MDGVASVDATLVLPKGNVQYPVQCRPAPLGARVAEQSDPPVIPLRELLMRPWLLFTVWWMLWL